MAIMDLNLIKGINTTMFILAVCGRRLFPESRIVGGEGSSYGKWPWQVIIYLFVFYKEY